MHTTSMASPLACTFPGRSPRCCDCPRDTSASSSSALWAIESRLLVRQRPPPASTFNGRSSAHSTTLRHSPLSRTIQLYSYSRTNCDVASCSCLRASLNVLQAGLAQSSTLEVPVHAQHPP